MTGFNASNFARIMATVGLSIRTTISRSRTDFDR